MKRSASIHVAICVLVFLALAGCSPSSGNTTTTVEVTRATEGNHIMIDGEVSMDFEASTTTAVTLIDTVTITLLDADQATGVMIFLPAGIQPGTRDIGTNESDVTARFDSLQDTTVTSYESTSGTLTLTQTEGSYSGSFTFVAGNGTGTITVTGSFESVASAGV